MGGYKHIERAVARFIAGRYRTVIEAGAGTNLHAASLLFRAGILIRCVDIIYPPPRSSYHMTGTMFKPRPAYTMAVTVSML